MRGKARLKHEIASRAEIDPAALPYEDAVLAVLRREHAAGREIILATAASDLAALKIAGHLRLFSRVIASSADRNNRAAAKLAAVREQVGNSFDHIGNGFDDLPMWSVCREGMIVRPSRRLLRRARAACQVSEVVARRSRFLTIIRAMRVYQWVKNLTVAIPLITSHQILNAGLISETLLAFLAFSFCASSVYLANDLADLEADRSHEMKRHRPLACGELPIPVGIALSIALLVAAFIPAVLLGAGFSAVLLLYYAASTLYSVRLKGKLMVDVYTLALLQVVRILGGGVATRIAVSEWLLAFALFFFVSRFPEALFGIAAADRDRQCHEGSRLPAVGPVCRPDARCR